MCEIPEAKTAIKGTLALNCQSKPINSPDTPIERHSRDNGPAAVLNYLLVGAEAHAENKELLLSLGITHILNLTTRSPKRFAEFTYHNIPLHVCGMTHAVSFHLTVGVTSTGLMGPTPVTALRVSI